MGTVLEIALLIVGFLVFDRVLLHFERKYYAKYNKFPISDSDPQDLYIERE